MAKAVVRKVPPDGGYGWVIVCASALSNVVIIPIMQSFGLIFKDTFANLGLSATEGSLIINLNAAFGMLVGLINGVLLKVFGYRKMAVAASAFVTVGVVLTSFSTTFTHFIIAYGLITSLGLGLSMSAFSLALNTYFSKKKNKAVGYAVTITGLGPILMPQLITVLLKIHTVQGATLILGGIAGHCFVAATLLQPLKWHMKEEKTEEEDGLGDIKEEDEENEVFVKKEGQGSVENRQNLSRQVSQIEENGFRKHKDSLWSIDPDIETAAIYGLDSTLGGSVLSLQSVISPLAPSRQTSVVSRNWKDSSTLSLERTKIQNQEPDVYNPDLSQPIRRKPLWKRVALNLARFFDLDLLKDPIYVNIMMGMSLAVFAEINFSVLTAFILADLGLTTEQSATFMSVLGIADILFRFLAPYIGDYLHKPARPMYMMTLTMLIITRFSLLISNNFVILLGVALGLGVAKGVRTVYMSLVIPTYVPLEKLASASGIQMMVNGICILVGGPVIGLVRDLTGSYTWCIVIMNCVTFTTIIMWTTEFLVLRYRKKKKAAENVPDQQDNFLN